MRRHTRRARSQSRRASLSARKPRTRPRPPPEYHHQILPHPRPPTTTHRLRIMVLVRPAGMESLRARRHQRPQKVLRPDHGLLLVPNVLSAKAIPVTSTSLLAARARRTRPKRPRRHRHHRPNRSSLLRLPHPQSTHGPSWPRPRRRNRQRLLHPLPNRLRLPALRRT